MTDLGLIQTAKHPKRNAVAITDFHIIQCEITIRHICNLFKRFAASAHLKQISSIGHKVATLRHSQSRNSTHLIGKKCF